MSNRIRAALLSSALGVSAATAASADVPQVATDVAPVHGLVARVMEGLGTPSLVVRPGASPHGYSLRPSEARSLQEADAVFWIGADLEPWLENTIETLAADARVITLLDSPETSTLSFREGTTFGAHEHHGHDAHADEDGAHDHHGVDPHAWLDPENAKAWLDVIAGELARLDPDNAEVYAANAEDGRAEIDAAIAVVKETIAPVRDMKFIVFHDAYQYFEQSFGLAAAGAISLSDASDPGPARIAEIRETVAELGVTCVFSEPQFNQSLVQTVLEGSGGKSGIIDPLGSDIEIGSDFYTALLRSIGQEIRACGD